MARSALTCHTQDVKDQPLQANNANKYLLMTEGTDSIPSHNPKHENTLGCTSKIIRDEPFVPVGNPSGEDNYNNHVAGPYESQSMTEISSAIANASEVERVALSEDVKLSTEYASDDNSYLSYNKTFNNQLMGRPTTTAEAVPKYTGKLNVTGKCFVQITSPNQKSVKDSTIQNAKSNCYIQPQALFKSFYNLPLWKFRKTFDIKQLSENGFYYDDKATKITCVICGYVVQENQPLEQLNEDHIWKSPNCSEFLNTSKCHVGTDCCEKINQEGIPETDGNFIHTECSESGSSHRPKASAGSVPKGTNSNPKMPDAEYVPTFKFSGTSAQQGRFQRTPRLRKISGVARKAKRRRKTRVARPPNTSASCIGDQQSKDGISQSQQNQQALNDTVESKESPNSYKRCLKDELHLQKIFVGRKRPKFSSFEKVRNQIHVPSQEDLDGILKELRHPNACLTDDSMKAILLLIGRKFPRYYIPCDMNKFFIENGVQALDTSSEFAQVIFVPPTKRNKEGGIGHFLLLTNIGCRKVFQVCDSLGERSMKLRDRSHELIRICLGFEKAPVVVVEEKAVSGQIGDIDCGLYVIACLVDICLGNGKRLNTVVYNQERMRSHLIETIECLFQNRPIQEFPAIKIDGEDRKSKFTLICPNIAQQIGVENSWNND